LTSSNHLASLGVNKKCLRH